MWTGIGAILQQTVTEPTACGSPWGGFSHEPLDGPSEEVLVAEADIAGHCLVPLPEGLGHALQLCAHLDEAVQLDARPATPHSEATHQGLRELGTQVVAHLGEGWRGTRGWQTERGEGGVRDG